jgi:hypothetical protein
MDDTGKFDLALAKPIVYDHGNYYTMGKPLGKFGYSVRKPSAKTAGDKGQSKRKKKA